MMSNPENTTNVVFASERFVEDDTANLWFNAALDSLTILTDTGSSEQLNVGERAAANIGTASRIEEHLSRLITDHPELLDSPSIKRRLQRLHIEFQTLPPERYSASKQVIRCLRYKNGMDYAA